MLTRLLVVCVVIRLHVAEVRTKWKIKVRVDNLGNEYAFPMCPLINKSPHYKAATRASALLRKAK